MTAISEMIVRLYEALDSIDSTWSSSTMTLRAKLAIVNSKLFDLRETTLEHVTEFSKRTEQRQLIVSIICMLILTLDAELAKGGD